ncbi:MAG: hypothetical protein O2955_08845 [Planctomycetota bacterium]|nr:hypothetical protein [Planctomycetota bacterium]
MSKTKDAEPSVRIDDTNQRFVGRWNHLISTTNWEKGQIIYQWRAELESAGASAAESSDEAWSRRVGNVSPQHVGRLRRVYRQYGESWQDYEGLYWSHFQAALDWNDAEMWLEGAVQNKWSVSQMRVTRWEAQGAPADLKPREEDIITAELDEDVAAVLDSNHNQAVAAVSGTIRDPGSEETFSPDFGSESAGGNDDGPFDAALAAGQVGETPRVRPFADLAALPEDLTQAFESFKLAILHHKIDGWREVSQDDLVSTLDALKELALAP